MVRSAIGSCQDVVPSLTLPRIAGEGTGGGVSGLRSAIHRDVGNTNRIGNTIGAVCGKSRKTGRAASRKSGSGGGAVHFHRRQDNSRNDARPAKIEDRKVRSEAMSLFAFPPLRSGGGLGRGQLRGSSDGPGVRHHTDVGTPIVSERGWRGLRRVRAFRRAQRERINREEEPARGSSQILPFFSDQILPFFSDSSFLLPLRSH